MIKKLLLAPMLAYTMTILGQTPMTPTSSSTTAGPDWVTTKITNDNALDFPWELTYGPDDNLWITERIGRKIVKVSTATATHTPSTLIDLSAKIATSKQGGLLGMAIHPDLFIDPNTTTNNYVFIAYTYTNSGGAFKLRIARLIYNHAMSSLIEDPTTSLANGAILEGLPGSSDHNSGRLIFGPDQKLYYTIGDQGANQFENACNPALSQILPTSTTDYDNYPGKTLRINTDGTIPMDNPMLGGIISHVYTYGHRNAQGLVFANDGSLYNSEHGAKVDDELNIVIAGKNYGWPEIAGYYDNMAYVYCNWSSVGAGCDANTFSNDNCPVGAVTATEFESYPTPTDVPANFQEPIGTYNSTTPIDPQGGFLAWPTIAPSSIDIHEVGSIPCWDKSLLIPSLKRGTIFRAQLNANGDAVVDDFYEEFHSSNDRYRDIAISPDGLTIYAITDNSGGTSGPSSDGFVSIANPGVIIKIEYVGPAVTDPITAPVLDDIVTFCPITLTAPTLFTNTSACQEITATTTNPMTYTSGTHVVTWSFDDSGTVVTANQNVIIDALQPPTNISVVPDTSLAVVTWDALDNVSFELRYREQGTTNWLTETTMSNSITLLALSVSTNYEYQMRVNCGDSQSDYTSIASFMTAALTYCDAQGNVNGQINYVELIGDSATAIMNASSIDTDYTDFTAVPPVDLKADGATVYTITVATSYNRSGVAAWIDLNQDGDFEDADEKVWDDEGINIDSPRTNTFTIPVTALAGSTRMRIASRQFFTPRGPCGAATTGSQNSEVEDYTVNIVGLTLSNSDNLISSFKMFPNPINDVLHIEIPQEYSLNNLVVELYDMQGRVVNTSKVTQSSTTITNLNTLSKGVYFIRFIDTTGVLGSQKLLKI